MDGYDENICMHALNRIFGFTPVKAQALISHMGSAKALFCEKRLRELMPFASGIDKICDREYEISEKEMSSLVKGNIHFVNYTQEHYPKLLLECPDFPIGIYVKSSTSPEYLFNNQNNIAIVGTRDLSPYGRESVRDIVHRLSMTDRVPCIVSGLAFGTDIIAHRAALDCRMSTIAVLPTGIDSVYPARHIRDAEKIVEKHGCALITDYPPNTTPYPVNFIRRNRIIAGLSRGVIITESKIKGGAMITANLAFSYNRDIYALPGRTSDPKSAGCNHLIRSKIAEPVLSADSLIEQLGLKIVSEESSQVSRALYHRQFQDNSAIIDNMSKILLEIKENPGIDLNCLSANLGLKTSEVIRAASMLETDGMICIDMLRRCSICK